MSSHSEAYPQNEPIYESSSGAVFEEIIDIDDIDEYRVHIGVPHSQRSPVAVVANVAYLTSLHGHNETSIRKLMDAGIPSIFIDAEGSHAHKRERSSLEHIKKATAIRLGRTALATHTILEHQAIEKYTKIDNEKFIFAGESRGAMTALAAESLNPDRVLYSDVVAPAMLELPRHRDLLRYARQIPGEVGALLHELSRMSPTKARHYAQTLRHPMSYLPYAASTLPALIWSNLQKYVKNLPDSTPRTITLFQKDHWTQPERWPHYFKGHDDTDIIQRKGRHLKLIRPAITHEARNRIRYVAHELRLAEQNHSYDYASVALQGIRDYRQRRQEATEVEMRFRQSA